MSTPRRLAALRELAARGATEGERAAARNALDKLTKPQPETPRGAYESSWEAWGSVRRPTTDSAAYWGELRDYPGKPGDDYADAFAYAFAGFKRASARKEPPARDFTPITTKAHRDPDNGDRLLIEVTTNAEMHQRFDSGRPGGLVFSWQGQPSKVTKLCGFVHDRAHARFYVAAHTRDLIPA